MAIEIRIRARGAKKKGSVQAVVRVGRFKSASKTIHVDTTVKAAEDEVRAWAQAYQETLRTQSKRGKPRADVTQLTIADLIKEYKEDPEFTDLRTHKDVDRLLGWFVLKYAHEKVRDFGVTALREARDQLRNGRAPGTVNRYLSAFRKVWNWGMSAELVLQGWPKKLMLREPGGRVRFLNDAEIGRLLKAAEADPMVHAAIVVSLATGLRQGELLRLQWKDIDFDKATATVHQSKTDQRRAVHLNEPAIEVLQKLQKAKVRSLIHVFINEGGKPLKKSLLEGRWYKIRTGAKLADFRWHDMRHTCASILLQSGATLAMVGSVLGHKSPGMTQRYAHLVQGAPVIGHDKLADKLRGK